MSETTSSNSQVTTEPIGKIRNPWMIIFLIPITLGIYGLVWYYSIIEELKNWRGKDLLYEVTPTRSYWHNNIQCRKYRVFSYETGAPVTINSSGDACRSNSDGKWFPSYMFTSNKRVSGKQLKVDMIGTGRHSTFTQIASNKTLDQAIEEDIGKAVDALFSIFGGGKK
jgi:hypothetical protein